MPDDIFAPGFFGSPTTAPPDPPRTPEDRIKAAATRALDLRAWRMVHSLSQFQLAVQLGVSLSTAIRWEHSGVPELRRAKVRAKLEEVR